MEDKKDERHSIWTVPSWARNIYIATFSLQFLGGCGILAYHKWPTTDPFFLALTAFSIYTAPLVITSSAISIITDEGVGIMVILGEYLTKRKQERAELEELRKENAALREAMKEQKEPEKRSASEAVPKEFLDE